MSPKQNGLMSTTFILFLTQGRIVLLLVLLSYVSFNWQCYVKFYCLLSGNMSEYKALCYALRRTVRAAKLWYRERIESHFQLNDSRHMWQGLKTICSSGNKSSAEVRADSLLAKELNTFYGRMQWRQRDSADQRVRKQQTEQWWSCYHRVGGRGSEGTKESEHQQSSRTWWEYWPCSEVLHWSACWFVYIHL